MIQPQRGQLHSHYHGKEDLPLYKVKIIETKEVTNVCVETTARPSLSVTQSLDTGLTPG